VGVSRLTAKTKRGTSWSTVCKLALRLPGVTEGTSYGTPALHVCKRFLARLKEDGETMAIKIGFPEREVLLELDPNAFYLTDHYRPYPAILVRLNKVPSRLVAQVLEQAWRFQAPRHLSRPNRRSSSSSGDPTEGLRPGCRPGPHQGQRKGRSRTTRG